MAIFYLHILIRLLRMITPPTPPHDRSDAETFSLDQLARLIKGELQKMRLELKEQNHNIIKVDTSLSLIATKLDSVENLLWL